MTSPELAELLARCGLGARVVGREAIGGGAVGRVQLLTTDAGHQCVLKVGDSSAAPVLEAEARGLAALRDTGTIRTPELYGYGADGDEAVPWLLLEYVRPGRWSAKAWERLGEGLAALHETPAPEHGVVSTFGWEHDNYIGPLPQDNTPHADWGEFWWSRRVAPQLERGASRYPECRPSEPRWRALEDALREPTPVGSVDHARTLHGDLWNGNVLVDPEGVPVLIDPAVYRGDPEVDLAMTELFGGFDGRWLDAYGGIRGIADAYDAGRRALYQLYPLLVHVNLFGRSYLAGALHAADRASSWLERR